MSWTLSFGSQNGKRWKMKGEKGCQSSYSPECSFRWKGRGLQQHREVQQKPPTRLHLCDEKDQSVVRADTWCLEDRSHKLLQDQCTAACQGAGGGLGSCYCTKSWNYPELTAISIQLFPWKLSLQQTLKFQISYIRQTLPLPLLSWWGAIPGVPAPLSLQNPVRHV